LKAYGTSIPVANLKDLIIPRKKEMPKCHRGRKNGRAQRRTASDLKASKSVIAIFSSA